LHPFTVTVRGDRPSPTLAMPVLPPFQCPCSPDCARLDTMSVQLVLCVGLLCALACVLTLTSVHLDANRRLSVITELQQHGQERDAPIQNLKVSQSAPIRNLKVSQSATRALLNTSYVAPHDSAKQGAVQGAGVTSMCYCNNVPANPRNPVVGSNPITITISQNGWTQFGDAVGYQQCYCFTNSVFNQGQQGQRIFCRFSVAGGRASVCAGSMYFVYDRYSSYVGLYEYLYPNERSPVSFQYSGPAVFRGFNQHPIPAIFTVVICNTQNDVPVNLQVNPLSLAWTANGQAWVSRSHSCTALDENILSARDGESLTCSYTVNGNSYTCGSADNLLLPWRYSPTSLVAAYIVCTGTTTPDCRLTSMSEWIRWPTRSS